MITLTNDMYHGLAKLKRWYRKYQHQVIELSGVVGTGAWQVLQMFIEDIGFDPREIMYLSYDQKEVIELASKRYHSYYINGIIYKYHRIVDFDTLSVINPASRQMEYVWKKEVRRKIDERYRLIVVMDSSLLDERTLRDLCSFGIPIILIRDPMLFPAPDSCTFLRDPNIYLRELQDDLIRNPITFFANKIIRGERIIPGSYDTVSVVTKKQMNLYNLKSADMVITMSEDTRAWINQIYRSKVLHLQTTQQIPGERLIIMSNHYGERLTNKDEKRIKVYLRKGLVGTIVKCNRHAAVTKYIPFDFRPDFYYDCFEELYMDRHHLNGVETPSRQIIPDEIVSVEYAYALTPNEARINHWEKVTMIADNDPELPEEAQMRLMYTGITRAKYSLTLVI